MYRPPGGLWYASVVVVGNLFRGLRRLPAGSQSPGVFRLGASATQINVLVVHLLKGIFDLQ